VWSNVERLTYSLSYPYSVFSCPCTEECWMQYQTITVFEPGSGFRARLSVGALYRTFEIAKITDVGLGATPIATPGSYRLTVKSRDGVEYEILNDQSAQGFGYCLHVSTQMRCLVPAGLEQLAWDISQAEFEHPLS